MGEMMSVLQTDTQRFIHGFYKDHFVDDEFWSSVAKQNVQICTFHSSTLTFLQDVWCRVHIEETLRNFQPRLRRQHLKLLDWTTGYLSAVFVTSGCFWQDTGTFSSCETSGKSLALTTTLDVFKEARRHLQPCLWRQNQIFSHEMSRHFPAVCGDKTGCFSHVCGLI